MEAMGQGMSSFTNELNSSTTVLSVARGTHLANCDPELLR